MPYNEFIKTMAESKLILTDSGGITQEAIFLRKPIIYLRNKSEYQYLFDGDKLVTTGKNGFEIYKHGVNILTEKSIKLDKIEDFGNGTAGKKIAKWISKKN